MEEFEKANRRFQHLASRVCVIEELLVESIELREQARNERESACGHSEKRLMGQSQEVCIQCQKVFRNGS